MRVLILIFCPMTEYLNETNTFRAFNIFWETPVPGELTIVYRELSYFVLGSVYRRFLD